MAAEPLGELDVLIGGDLTGLDQAIQDAQSHANAGAQAIAGAFNVPDVGTPMAEGVGNIANALRDATPPAFAFSEGAQEIIDKGAELQSQYDQAARVVEELQAALANGSASEEDVARATEEADAAFQRLNPDIHESEELFRELGDKLLEFASIVGIATGLEEIGRESLSAAANIQRFEGSMTALTGSAEVASEAVEKMRTLAMDDALSFPQLLQADQRMTAMGFDAAQIEEALRGVADASRALGRDFDTVSSSVERLALSGNAGARQLVQLGLNTNDLATAMGVTEAQAKDFFKVLDQSDRLDVLNAAMVKFAGTAEATAGDMTGSWQRFKNQLDFTSEAMGKVVGPAATFLLGGLQQIFEWTEKAIDALSRYGAIVLAVGEGWTQAATHGQSFITAIAENYARITQATTATKSWSDQLAEADKQIELTVERNQRIKDAVDHASASIGTQTDKVTEAVKAFDRAKNSYDAVLEAWSRGIGTADGVTAAQNRMNVAYDHAVSVAIQSKDILGEQVAAFEKVAKAVEAVATAHEAWGVKLDTIHSKVGDFIPQAEQAALDIASMAVAQAQVNDAFGMGSDKASDFTSMLQGMQGTMADVNAQFKDIVDSQNQVSDGSDLVAAAMRQVGLTSASVTDGVLSDLRNVFQELLRLRDEYGDATGVIGRDLETVGDKITKLGRDHEDLKGKVHEIPTEWQRAVAQIDNAISNDLSRAMSDIIFQTGKIGDSFVKLGKDVVDIILNHIIKEALQPLLDMLDKVLGKVFGAAGSAAGGAAGSAGGVAGAAGGTIGDIGGGIGSIASIGGAVGSIVGAIGTFIEGSATNAKLFHIETSLIEIRNTIQGYHDPIWRTAVTTEYTTAQLSQVDYPLFSKMVTALEDMDSIMRAGVPVVGASAVTLPSGVAAASPVGTYNISFTIVESVNPTATANAIFNHLRTVLPQFGAAA